MKKIALGVNLFGTSNRTNVSLESLKRIQKKFDYVDVYNVQFADKSIKGRQDSDLKLYDCLKQTNHDYIKTPSQKTFPVTKEIFDKLAELNYDYFGFTNDDIIVSNRYINFIQETNYDCYPASRLAIEDIQSLDEPIKASNHYQVAGFDTFVIKTSWWIKNRDKFPLYIIGRPCWDIHYATLMMRHSNSTLCNKWPPPTFHIMHDDFSHSKPSPERDYNYSVYWQPYKFDSDMWHNYLFNVLMKRPGDNYLQPHNNELELEKQYFNDNYFKANYWSYR